MSGPLYTPADPPSHHLTGEEIAQAHTAHATLRARPGADWCEVYFLRMACQRQVIYPSQAPLLAQLLRRAGGAR